MQRFIIEFGNCVKQFTGEEPNTWFWNCMEAIKQVIEDWHIKDRPEYIRIFVRREYSDKGALLWLKVYEFKMTHECPWINLDQFEQDREFIFMLGEAMAMAWRDKHAKAVVEKYGGQDE